MDDFKYGDRVIWGTEIVGMGIHWSTVSSYTYLCKNTQGWHVLETDGTSNVFIARNVRKV
jgi:hypothetical protein